MDFAVVDIKGKDTKRKVSIADELCKIEPNAHAMYLDVKLYLANKRQGTHKAKERAEITGSTKKIKKQKGTGTARAGSIKSPTFVGGGRVFGPRPRSYSFKLNKKLKRIARKSALSTKVTNDSFIVVEDFNFKAPKTKEMISVISSLSLDNKKVLFLLGENADNVYLSGRNLPKVNVKAINDLCTYDIMNADSIVLAEKAVDNLENVL